MMGTDESGPEPFEWDDYGYETTFVENMKTLRQQRGMSQSEFARRASARGLSFHQPTVQRIESGQRPLRLTEAIHIAAILGTDLQSMSQDLSLPFAYDGLVREIDPKTLFRSYEKDVESFVRRARFALEEPTDYLNSYLAACKSFGIEPNPELVSAAKETIRVLDVLREEAESFAVAFKSAKSRLERMGREYPDQWSEPEMDGKSDAS
ncbi:helix-turn-helix transcriptional regulator [Cellulosimicrobium cellulans]|uniref:helix-turn-helix domain-containing protein n=1 Tax=Cellulosimicrobium cellulans TaxID=1710 RepID=UPI00196519E7|nr:helix-turn-helix transcriptional regulator [Cellulosimicrobium cellulans]MBN0039476.1 helix-turn-helix transcriptional regulator [Cellulosimicrobium cellulans]